MNEDMMFNEKELSFLIALLRSEIAEQLSYSNIPHLSQGYYDDLEEMRCLKSKMEEVLNNGRLVQSVRYAVLPIK